MIIRKKNIVIFATDVVGYSKLEKDEDSTLKSFKACKEILESSSKNMAELYSTLQVTPF